jgi:hypothetical protein
MPTNFFPEPGGPETKAVEQVAARGTSEETPKTIARLVNAPLDGETTRVKETLEPRTHLDVKPAPRIPAGMNLFQHPDAHPFALDVALMKEYGPEWLEWEMPLLAAKVRMDFKTQSISTLNIDKIQAVKTLHLVDTFWSEWLVFNPCTQALSGMHAEFRVLSAPTVPQAMIAVDIAAKLRSDLPYSLEVKGFLSAVHIHDGMLVPIDPLADFVEVDASRYDVDVARVRKLWEGVRAANKAPSGMTPENVQLQRMLEAHNILEDSRRQLRDQLPLLYHD